MARSTLTGDFTRTETVTLTVIEGAPHPLMVLDQPQPGSTLHQPFDLGGWAIDRGAPVGPGVDTVHVWAFPSGPAAPTFLGEATYGRHRPGVGALFGSRFANSGFDLFSVNSLSPDAYTLTAFALSTVTGTFNNSQSVSVVIAAPVSAPDMVIDLPTAGSVTQPFRLAGWALDRGAQNGTGVSTIHVWAWPEGGGGPSFVGVASYGDARPDVAAFVGDPRFTEVGYDLTVSGLPPGTYDLTVYAFSTVTDDFNNARLVRVTVN